MSLCRSVGARYSMTRDASGMVVVWDHQERDLPKPLPHERTSAATVTISSSLAHDGFARGSSPPNEAMAREGVPESCWSERARQET